MRYRAIIFDMDGTIIDTEQIWKQATHELITSRGLTLTPEVAQDFKKRMAGLAMRPSCLLIKNHFNLPESIDELIAEKHKRADELYQEKVTYINGFLDFHGRAQKHNLKMGIATNATAQTVHITNQKLNLERLFGEHIYNISHVNYVGKPHPAIYLHAAEKLVVEPAVCIAIEDSAHGIKAAKEAGMFCIGINTSGIDELLQDADMIIQGYEELDLPALLGI